MTTTTRKNHNNKARGTVPAQHATPGDSRTEKP